MIEKKKSFLLSIEKKTRMKKKFQPRNNFAINTKSEKKISILQ